MILAKYLTMLIFIPLITYCIVCDIRDALRKPHRDTTGLLNDSIYINLSEEELKLLERLTTLNGSPTKSLYVREKLLDKF